MSNRSYKNYFTLLYTLDGVNNRCSGELLLLTERRVYHYKETAKEIVHETCILLYFFFGCFFLKWKSYISISYILLEIPTRILNHGIRSIGIPKINFKLEVINSYKQVIWLFSVQKLPMILNTTMIQDQDFLICSPLKLDYSCSSYYHVLIGKKKYKKKNFRQYYQSLCLWITKQDFLVPENK